MKLTDGEIIKALKEGKRITSKSKDVDCGWCIVLNRKTNDLVYLQVENNTEHKLAMRFCLLTANDWEIVE